MLSEGLEVRQSPIQGRGVFARSDFEPGATVHLMQGARLTGLGLLGRLLTRRLRWDDALQIGRVTYLIPDELSVAFNHACEPSCGLRGERELFALRPIHVGDELTFDYSVTVLPNLFTRSWSLRCRCGGATCRGTVGNLATVPEDVLRRYLAADALQAHVRALALARLSAE